VTSDPIYIPNQQIIETIALSDFGSNTGIIERLVQKYVLGIEIKMLRKDVYEINARVS
jgi:hypothetical protein